MNTLYDILKVDKDSAPDMIRKAYRDLARKFHPDVSEEPEANEAMAKINAAFETLIDPIRRMEYDARINGGNIKDPQQQDEPGQDRRPLKTRLIYRLTDHKTPIYGLSFVHGSNELVSTSFDNELIFWNLDTGTLIRQKKLEGGAVSSLACSEDGNITAAGSSESTLTVWSINSSDEIGSWRINTQDWVCSVQPSPEGTKVAYGTVNSKVGIIHSKANISLISNNGHLQSITALAWSNGGHWLATGSADATVKIWQADSGKEIISLANIRSTVTAMTFSPDNTKLAVAAVDLSIRIFDLADPGQFKIFFGHTRPIECLQFHPEGKFLVSTGRDGVIGIWNLDEGNRHYKIDASHQALNCISFNFDGTKLAAGGLDKVLRVWDIQFSKFGF